MHGPGSAVSRGCGMRQRALACVLVAAACGGASQSNVRPLGGILTVAPATLDFGPVVVNETATQDLLVTNGDGRAETAITVAPPLDNGVFSVDPGGEQILPSQQSIVVRLQFRPDRLGSFSSAIPITPCPTCSPRSITLTGKGVDKLLLVQPETLDFGELRLAAEATQPFTVTNTSKGPVAIEAIALAGSADLTAALDGGQPPRTLAPGETIGGTARFHAQNLGAQQAQASLRASDGGPGILSLTGTGIGPVLQALPKSLFVGGTALGTTRTAPVTVTNVGVDPKNVVPLVLTGVRIDGYDGTWAVQGV